MGESRSPSCNRKIPPHLLELQCPTKDLHSPNSGEPVEPNHFVETTLNYVLTYIAHIDKKRSSHGFKPASLLVLADNDYYSKPSSTSSSSAPPAARFTPFHTTLRNAHKTGLGSSAAIVTSLTAALLSHYLPPSLFDLSTPSGRRVLHNLAQVAHCSAQGKIGSGFDVASAVYGSCLYRRFSPDLLAGLKNPGEAGFAHALVSLVEEKEWDCEIDKGGVGEGLPKGVVVRMCDVDCGTQTVGMVKGVNKWKAENAERAEETYGELQVCVDNLAVVLREQKVDEIGRALGRVREIMRRMGRESGVPIEPESQEAMMNELEKVPGVYGSVVPGAGGYDAAAVVMRDDEETERLVKEFLGRWSREHEIQVRLMEVKGETEGVRKEMLEEFKAWIHR